jgi:hypothetical protein
LYPAQERLYPLDVWPRWCRATRILDKWKGRFRPCAMEEETSTADRSHLQRTLSLYQARRIIQSPNSVCPNQINGIKFSQSQCVKIRYRNNSQTKSARPSQANGLTRTSTYIWGKIKCRGGVSILCWPVTLVMQPLIEISYKNRFMDTSIKNSELNNVSNVVIIQEANTKLSVGKHRPPTNAKVGSLWRSKYPLLTGHTRCAHRRKQIRCLIGVFPPSVSLGSLPWSDKQ